MNVSPSLEQFLHGTPERVLQPVTPKSVLITWLHTNEELAPRTMHHILTTRPDLVPYVSYVCGNPLTASTDPQKGFTDTDLNRSFNPPGGPESYEEQRAVEVLSLVKKYPYVLDLHGAVGSTNDFIIVSEEMVDSPTVLQLIAASKNKWVVVMPKEVARKSLIGSTANAIVMEYYVGHVAAGIRDAESIIESLVEGKIQHKPLERQFFYVTGTIAKSEDPGLDAKNFEFIQDKQGGYYPIILGTGPRSYREDPTKDYCCFAARRKEVKIL